MRKLSFFFLLLLACPWDGDVSRTRGHETRLRPSNAGRKHGSQPGREGKKREETSEIRASLTVVGSKKKMGIPIYNTRSDHFFLPSLLTLTTSSFFQSRVSLTSLDIFLSNTGNQQQQQNSTMKFSIFSVLLVATIGAQAKQKEPKKKEAPFVSLYHTLPYLSTSYLPLHK